MDTACGSKSQIQTKGKIPTRKWKTKPSPAILKSERFNLHNQSVRSSGSVAANWIEADEALSKKDFLMRVKICRKEAKESRLFLRLVDAGLSQTTASARDKLAAEARELTLIFSAIISKSA
jgi:four helix bundle protein